MPIALITGITGQDGAYLSKFLLGKGYEIFGISRSDNPNLDNLQYLGIADRVKILTRSLLDYEAVRKLISEIKPSEIYNLAGQSSVDYSFKEPVETITHNLNSVLNLLEAIRQTDKKIRLFQATTCEIFSANNKLPIKEDSPLFPSSPYGVSKAAGHLMVINYRETYGLFCVSGIMFNHESFLRKPHYFIRRLIKTARAISAGADEYIYLGQADNRRDFGFAPDYVEAMWLMLQAPQPRDYVICSGKSVSIREITEYVLAKFGVSKAKIKIDAKLFRSPNVPDLYGDPSRINKELQWYAQSNFFEALDEIIEADRNNTKFKNILL